MNDSIDAECLRRWTGVDPERDAMIRRRFLESLEMAGMGAFDRWVLRDEERTALLVLLVEFPRCLFRGQARAFYYDGKALALSQQALDTDRHLAMHPAYAYFTLMPSLYSEQLHAQERCVAEFLRLLDQPAHGMQALLQQGLAAAQENAALMQRFGRFPERNAVLGRTSSADEAAYLDARKD